MASMAPNSSRLILVRHGRTIDNQEQRLTGWRDADLDPLGLAQARLLANHVAKTYRPDIVFTSPLARARDTARIIGRVLRLEPIIVESFKEIHFGDIEGLPDHHLPTLHPELYARSRDLHDMDFAWPNGEARWQFNARIRGAFDDVIARSRGCVAVVATHGGVIANLLSTIAHGTSAYWPKYLPHNCSITEIESDGETFHLGAFDDVSFLPKDAQTTQFVIDEP